MARNDPQLNVRIPQQLRDRLEHSASIHGRSVTQEVMWVLENHLPTEHVPAFSGVAERNVRMSDVAATRPTVESLRDSIDELRQLVQNIQNR